jgi:mRNA-degrading endonuclease RelE of RelBE toxin-antitoxin system
MIFIETSIFSRIVQILLTDEEYRDLQNALIVQPDIGSVIPGAGGLRKMRWSYRGKGKRGGVRVIYYLVTGDRILMVYIYPKGKQDDLTPEQLKRLRKIIVEERK